MCFKSFCYNLSQYLAIYHRSIMPFYPVVQSVQKTQFHTISCDFITARKSKAKKVGKVACIFLASLKSKKGMHVADWNEMIDRTVIPSCFCHYPIQTSRKALSRGKKCQWMGRYFWSSQFEAGILDDFENYFFKPVQNQLKLKIDIS